MTSLWMTFVLALVLVAAASYAQVLKEAIASIVTLWLAGSGSALAIFVGGNAFVTAVQSRNGHSPE